MPGLDNVADHEAMIVKWARYNAVFQTRGGLGHVSPAPARSVVPIREFRRH